MTFTTFTNGTVANATEVNANFTYINNKLKDVVPTLPVGTLYVDRTSSAWDTDPTDLSNTTDEDLTTATGAGIDTKTGDDKYCAIQWDTGSNTLMKYLWIKFDWTETSDGSVGLYTSEDGTTWTQIGTNIYDSTVTYNQQALTEPRKFRYLAIMVGALAGTVTLTTNEVICY